MLPFLALLDSIDKLFFHTGALDLNSMLSTLADMEIRSLMVEGGARVISSFLQSGLVDSLIITVCPTMVGEGGVGYDVKEQVRRFHRLEAIMV